MNKTIMTKEELEKISNKYEDNVRNLTTDLSNYRMENSRSSNATEASISSIKSSVSWILNFIKYLTGNQQTDALPRTENSNVNTVVTMGLNTSNAINRMITITG